MDTLTYSKHKGSHTLMYYCEMYVVLFTILGCIVAICEKTFIS
ncbi:MAG TPA: hypothetical protein VK808_06070 [Bacteroidia bacterium]|nr:hypothetical protein [Bacteroidia bacterium]